jgi:hypothetical protein
MREAFVYLDGTPGAETAALHLDARALASLRHAVGYLLVAGHVRRTAGADAFFLGFSKIHADLLVVFTPVAGPPASRQGFEPASSTIAPGSEQRHAAAGCVRVSSRGAARAGNDSQTRTPSRNSSMGRRAGACPPTGRLDEPPHNRLVLLCRHPTPPLLQPSRLLALLVTWTKTSRQAGG